MKNERSEDENDRSNFENNYKPEVKLYGVHGLLVLTQEELIGNVLDTLA